MANNADGWSFKTVVPMEMAIVCQDMDKMLEFYIGVLGLKLFADATAKPENSTKLGANPHGFRIVRLQTASGEIVKLVQPLQDAPAPHPLPAWSMVAHGYAYLTFIVDDMPKMVKRLKEKGVKTLSDGPVESRPGVFAYFFVDPENNFLEFAQYPDIAAYRPDLFKK
ncbi:MAG: VOC family protein [Deltaproteobacteria bacterium]|nr:VOC family protein [Deltaproteobacteria bacterium]